MGERVSGKMKRLSDQKGYGFISRSQGGEDLFVHQSSIKSGGVWRLEVRKDVEFVIKVESDGRSEAVDITGPGESFVEGNQGGRVGVTTEEKVDIEVEVEEEVAEAEDVVVAEDVDIIWWIAVAEVVRVVVAAVVMEAVVVLTLSAVRQGIWPDTDIRVNMAAAVAVETAIAVVNLDAWPRRVQTVAVNLVNW